MTPSICTSRAYLRPGINGTVSRHALGLLAVGLFLVSTALSEQRPSTPRALFNGRDLSGWKVYRGDSKVWGVDQGLLYCSGSGGGWLMSEEEFADFELWLDYRMPRMGNSGIALRAPLEGDPAYAGMEIQLLDDDNWPGLRPEQYCGSIYDVVPAKRGAIRPAGQWNHVRILAKGRNIQVEINGQLVVHADLERYKDRVHDGPANKKRGHPGLARARGHIGLQSYNYRVDFKDIRVRTLP